jgi:hypothetical protein
MMVAISYNHPSSEYDNDEERERLENVGTCDQRWQYTQSHMVVMALFGVIHRIYQ